MFALFSFFVELLVCFPCFIFKQFFNVRFRLIDWLFVSFLFAFVLCVVLALCLIVSFLKSGFFYLFAFVLNCLFVVITVVFVFIDR